LKTKFVELLKFILPFSSLNSTFASSIMLRCFLFALHAHFDYRLSHDDRQGFVGTPGPAIWRGSPACFAAERPSPKVSFFRVFGPYGP
jgi:hypothetical protein